MRRLVFFPFVLATLACATEPVAPPQGGEERGPLGKADLSGSCEGRCGLKSLAKCWCDDWCEYFGDCCADKAAICDGGGEAGSEGGDDESSAGGEPEPTAVTAVAAGGSHTCALLDTGAVRCWGDNAYGQLGYGHTDRIGDDETVASVGDVDVGGTVVQLSAALRHTCALLDTGAVRCWGDAYAGKLGYGNGQRIGDDEVPAAAGDVDVGETVAFVGAAGQHTCAVTTTGALRCWGTSLFNGIPNSGTIGDDEVPAAVDPVQIGGTVEILATGSSHTCALLDTGGVRCFGTNLQGQCAYWNTNSTVGDNEHPSEIPEASLYAQDVVELEAGNNHTCVRYSGTSLHCWGLNWDHQAGYRTPEVIANPLHVSAVNLDEGTVDMALGGYHSCALLESGAVKCWGGNSDGQLGAGHTNVIGDNEDPSHAPDVALLGEVTALAAGARHTCALLADGQVQCWGRGSEGQLGHGNTQNIGDDEPADAAGVVEVL